MPRWALALAVLAFATSAYPQPYCETIRASPVMPGATILLIEPDIRLGRMRVAGGAESRPDWSATAIENVRRHARNAILSDGRQVESVTRSSLSAEARQILVLNAAVRVSMRQSLEGDPPPATMPRDRSWTLGPGAQALRGDTNATRALLIDAGGEITGTLRALYVVGAAASGVLAETGLQRASAVLVDLDTGDIIWRNAVVARPDEDMRDDDGAHRLVTALLQGAPL